MAEIRPSFRLSLDHARAVVFAAQGLPPGSEESLEETLERTGLVRTLGGTDVYLAVAARRPGLSRADLDAAVERGEVRVSPAVRGCIYLVPRRFAALCLRLADRHSRTRAEREHRVAGIRPGEVEAVAEAVADLLMNRGPLSTDAVRRALPAGTVRSLGEPGKKVGITSPLPPALRRLEFDGRIERRPEDGRLDRERYLWAPTKVDPFAQAQVPEDPEELFAAVAEVFFRAAGLATVSDFAGWAGLSHRDARAATESLDLVPVAVEGADELFWVPAERRPLLAAAPDIARGVGFLPFEDNLLALGGPARMFDASYHALPVPTWGRGDRTTPLGQARFMVFRTLAADGRAAGFWEFDPGPRAVVWARLGGAPAARPDLVEAAVGVARLLAEIGHGRSFNLDTDADLVCRAAWIRALPGACERGAA